MSCPDQFLFDRYLDGNATVGEAARLEAHLDGCTTCSERLSVDDSHDLVRELRQAVAGLPAAKGPPTDAEVRAALPGPPDLERYRILRRIGEGGMGIVYEAEQRNPRRRVALKVLRPLLAAPRALTRFRIEADILGRLDHPGIARIHEAGTFEAAGGSQPFFAMELVEGLPLDAFAAERQLDVAARLGLVAAIADAVQHAHQKGVIHRDLKFSNVLVDAAARPRVLDFGVARLAGEADAAATAEGQLVGTVRSMSPEQVSGDPAAVDARSDVHALGLLMFELVSGKPAYALDGKSVPEMIRTIAEAPPRRLGDLDRRFRGDLDAIAAKALEKDKERRYASAAALADDLRRFLADEPVTARTPSVGNRIRKFVRRNRALTGILAALFLSLAAGIIATSLQAASTRRAADAMRAARDEARFRLEQSDQVFQLLDDVFAEANPELRVGPEPTMREAVERAAGRLDAGRFGPRVEGAARAMIGQLFLTLGVPKAAREHLERALALLDGPPSLDLVKILACLAELAREEDDLPGAEGLHRRAVAESRRLPEKDREWERRTNVGLGRILVSRARFDEARPLLEDALEILRREKVGTRELGVVLMNLAMIRRKEGDEAAAAALMIEALAIRRTACGDDHLEVADALHGLSGVLVARGEFEEAENHAVEALRIRRTQLGDRHRDVAVALMRLGTIQLARRKQEVAERNLREAHELCRELFQPAHSTTLMATCSLASALRHADPGEAERLLREALRAVRDAGTEDSEHALGVLEGLEDLLIGANRHDEALVIFARHAAAAAKLLPPTSVMLANVRHRYGWCLGVLQRNEESEKELLAGLAIYDGLRGGGHPRVPKVLADLVSLYQQWGRQEDAARAENRIAVFERTGR